MALPKQPVEGSSSDGESLHSVPRTVAGGRFEVRELLGSGSFGVVHRGVDKETGDEVALKFESVRTGMLQGEAAVLRNLQSGARPGFVRLHFVGLADSMRCMVTDLLESNLQDRLVERQGKFNVQTTVLLAQQLISGMEYLHSTGFVHCDVKPENVMCGVRARQHHVYLIDFGLAQKYFGRRRHVPMKHGPFTGTVRYASVNAMRCITQSRRDDLEAIGYMLMYFLRGSLPWSGLPARDSEDRFRKVRDKKARTDMRDLCAGFPTAFEQYLTDCRGMDFDQRPDYAMLSGRFGDLRKKMAEQACREVEDHELEWIAGPPANAVPLQQAGPSVLQPEEEQHPHRWLGLARLCGRSMASAPDARDTQGGVASAL